MKRIVGIDLGTTNSSAAVMEGDDVFVIPNDRGHRLTPSVVGFTERGEVLVGEAARNQAAINPAGTVQNVKRDMGGPKTFAVNGRTFTPPEISAFILRKLKGDVENYLGRRMDEAVITVPAHFSENQRRATLEAGRLAGFNVRRILNEPTAAALAHAVRRNDLSNVVVYDFGGGTFDVTCLVRSADLYTVRACRGDNNLGGVDLDARLFKQVRERFQRETGFDACADAVLAQQLREKVEAAKIELSGRETAVIALPFVNAGRSALHLRHEISREEFEKLAADLVEKTVSLTAQAMQEAGFSPHGIDAIILSGGSSRIPLVQRRLESVFGKAFARRINPDEVVALGAAVYAAKFLDSDSGMKLRDVTAYTLGIETEGDRFVPLIGRNEPIPLRVRKTFTTVSDGQQEVEVNVLQGEWNKASRNESLARFSLAGIRDGARGEPRISIEFSVDDDGMVSVSARDHDTASQRRMKVVPRGSGAAGTTNQRLRSLIGRLEAELSSGRVRDVQLRVEMQEHLEAARNRLRRPDGEGLDQYLAVLDTLLKEWEVRRKISAVASNGNR